MHCIVYNLNMTYWHEKLVKQGGLYKIVKIANITNYSILRKTLIKILTAPLNWLLIGLIPKDF